MASTRADGAAQAGETDNLRVLGGHSIIYAASSLLGQLGSLLTFPLYTRSLGPELYGVLALALSAAGVLRTLVIAGTNTALMHERISSSDEQASRITAAALTYVIGSSAVVGVVLLVGRAPLARALSTSVTVGLAAAVTVYIALDSLLEITLALARAESRPADYAYANALRVGVTFASAAVFLIMWDAGPEGAILGMAVGSIVAGLWLAFRLGIRPQFAGCLPWVPRLLRQGGPLLPANLASWIADLSDRYLLLLLLGSSATVGLYSAGYRVGSLITALFVGPFHTAFLPLALKTYERDGRDRTYDESSRLFVVLGAVVVCLLQAASVPVVRILAGQAYAGAERVVGAVALGCLLSGAAMLMTPAALKTGRSHFLAGAYGTGAAVNVALNFVLIPRLGMEGAAVATLLGYAAVLATMYVLMPSALWPAGSLAVVLRVVPVMGLCTVASLVDYGSVGMQTVASAGLAALGLGLLILLRVLTLDDVRLVWRVIASLASASVARFRTAVEGIGTGLKRLARKSKRIPKAFSDLWGVQVRRWRRRHEHVGGECLLGPYAQFVLERDEQIVRAAAGVDRLVAGEMVTFGRPWRWRSGRDWHLDPWSGRRWHAWLPSALVDVNHVVSDSDVQSPWESSRLEHVWRGALAYAHSGDETYAQWVIGRLDEWGRWNPAGWGVNWTVAMEVGLRAIALAEVRSLLCTSSSWTPRGRAAHDEPTGRPRRMGARQSGTLGPPHSESLPSLARGRDDGGAPPVCVV